MAMSSMSDIVLPTPKPIKVDDEEERQLKRDELLAMNHSGDIGERVKILKAIQTDGKLKHRAQVIKNAKKKAKLIVGNLKKENEKKGKKERDEASKVR